MLEFMTFENADQKRNISKYDQKISITKKIKFKTVRFYYHK